jgi:hypothetical protein
MSQQDKIDEPLPVICTAFTCFAGALVFHSSDANAVFWRGITAPIIKEPPSSPCQWIRVNGCANVYTELT